MTSKHFNSNKQSNFMKYSLITGLFLSISLLSYGQSDTTDTINDQRERPLTKKGREILPQSGDIALGFNAVPMIDFALRSLNHVSIFGGTGGTPNTGQGSATQAVQYTANNNNQVVGKYYLDNNTAIRGKFGVNTISGLVTNPVQDGVIADQASRGTVNDQLAARLVTVDDEMSFSRTNILVVGGLEKRRGYGRLQGFYGAELGFGMASGANDYTYGNEFSGDFVVEHSSINNFNSILNGNNAGNPTLHDPSSSNTGDFDNVRRLRTEFGGSFTVGVRAFIGVEYFFAPKMSVGAEYGWGYAFTSGGKTTFADERFYNGQDGPTAVVEEYEVNGKDRRNVVGVDNNGSTNQPFSNVAGGSTALAGGSGSIILLFHF
jgi:hypothetical protein